MSDTLQQGNPHASCTAHTLATPQRNMQPSKQGKPTQSLQLTLSLTLKLIAAPQRGSLVSLLDGAAHLPVQLLPQVCCVRQARVREGRLRLHMR